MRYRRLNGHPNFQKIRLTWSTKLHDGIFMNLTTVKNASHYEEVTLSLWPSSVVHMIDKGAIPPFDVQTHAYYPRTPDK